ncbi:MAG: CDP-glycerol glycerophosphotransferase family protein [Bacteroidaceae bacterium]|nr:CDP-glycerol glycerophosphotransferase family protein [Bacteroidaceae bacterium]
MTLNDKFERIEELRLNSVHDLYLVAGQLQVSNIFPIDSWTFFMWLQKQGVPSKYILKKEDSFYDEVANFKDVIAIDSFNKGYELLELEELWARACAFVVEWDLGGTEVDYWLHDLPDCRYVFLQHGVIGTCITDLLLYPCKHIYNDINVSSEREKMLINAESSSKKCFIGGLPRFEFLKKGSDVINTSEKVIFIMFTWRNIFSKEPKNIFNSRYWEGLKSLLSHEIVLAYQKNGVKFVVALHHSLFNNIETLQKPFNIDFIEQKEISRWIRDADMFITDFSSASFDFLYQHKPVIYWIPDKDDSLYEEGGLDRLKIDSALEHRRMFFNLAETLDDVIKYLQIYINNSFYLEDSKREIADSWFDYRKNFSQRIFLHIEERLVMERMGYGFAQLLYEKKMRELLIQLNDSENRLKECNCTIENNQRKVKRLQKDKKILVSLFVILSILIIVMVICVRFL